jgi:ubiquinone/menaquinone biosynthesis C-methylase UbiE
MEQRTKDQWLQILESYDYGSVIPGSAAAVCQQAEYLYQTFLQKGIIREGDSILDLGCGIGRLGIPLTQMNVTYAGLDIVPRCIDFCQKTFKPWPNFSFNLLDIKNPFYNPNGSLDPKQMVLPYADNRFDTVIAISLFTHFPTVTECWNYLKEIHRVLKPNGRLCCTWFCSPPNTSTNNAERAVFPEWIIRLMLTDDFSLVEEWGGQTTQHHDQRYLYLVRSQKAA